MSSKFLEAHISTCSIVHKQQKSSHLVMIGAVSSVISHLFISQALSDTSPAPKLHQKLSICFVKVYQPVMHQVTTPFLASLEGSEITADAATYSRCLPKHGSRPNISRNQPFW